MGTRVGSHEILSAIPVEVRYRNRYRSLGGWIDCAWVGLCGDRDLVRPALRCSDRCHFLSNRYMTFPVPNATWVRDEAKQLFLFKDSRADNRHLFRELKGSNRLTTPRPPHATPLTVFAGSCWESFTEGKQYRQVDSPGPFRSL